MTIKFRTLMIHKYDDVVTRLTYWGNNRLHIAVLHCSYFYVSCEVFSAFFRNLRHVLLIEVYLRPCSMSYSHL